MASVDDELWDLVRKPVRGMVCSVTREGDPVELFRYTLDEGRGVFEWQATEVGKQVLGMTLGAGMRGSAPLADLSVERLGMALGLDWRSGHLTGEFGAHGHRAVLEAAAAGRSPYVFGDSLPAVRTRLAAQVELTGRVFDSPASVAKSQQMDGATVYLQGAGRLQAYSVRTAHSAEEVEALAFQYAATKAQIDAGLNAPDVMLEKTQHGAVLLVQDQARAPVERYRATANGRVFTDAASLHAGAIKVTVHQFQDLLMGQAGSQVGAIASLNTWLLSVMDVKRTAREAVAAAVPFAMLMADARASGDSFGYFLEPRPEGFVRMAPYANHEVLPRPAKGAAMICEWKGDLPVGQITHESLRYSPFGSKAQTGIIREDHFALARKMVEQTFATIENELVPAGLVSGRWARQLRTQLEHGTDVVVDLVQDTKRALQRGSKSYSVGRAP